MTPDQAKKTQRLENIAHYMAAFVIFMKGFDKYDNAGKPGLGIFFMVLGVLLVLGTIFHHKAEKYLKHFKGIVFIVEAVVLSIVGYLYLMDGKAYIQYVCFASAVMFLIAGIVYFRNAGKVH